MKLLKNILVLPFLGFSLLTSCSCHKFTDLKGDDNNENKETNNPGEDIVVPIDNPVLPTPVSPGDASITFDKLEKDIKILVPSENFKSQLTSYRSTNLNLNFSASLKKHVFAVATPSTDTLEYTSSNPDIASVDENGLVTGHLANRSCVITVKSSSGAVNSIIVNTYTEENYFVYDTVSMNYYENATLDNGTEGYDRKSFSLPGITKCIDRDIEELILPTKNPNNEDLRFVDVCAFYQTRKLRSVVVPTGYYNIGESNFTGAYQLETLHLSNTLYAAGFHYGSFLSSKNSLRNVTIDNDNKFLKLRYYNGSKTSGYFVQDHLYVGSPKKFGVFDTFVYAYGKDVTGKNLLTSDDYSSYYESTSGLSSLGCCSLVGLDSLVNLEIPNGIIIIGNTPNPYSSRSFPSACVSGCKNLKSVSLPPSGRNSFGITSINEFSDCPNLETFIVSENIVDYTTKDDSGHETNSLISLQVNNYFVDKDNLINNSAKGQELKGKNIPVVIRGTKKSTFKDNATYFASTREKRLAAGFLNEEIVNRDDYSTISFSSSSFVGVDYNGTFVLPNNTLGIGWGAFYNFGGSGVYIPKTASFTNGGRAKYETINAETGERSEVMQYINYGGYITAAGKNNHILTYSGIFSSNKYCEPIFIDNNIIGLENMNADETQTNPLCFFCDKDFKIYLEDKSKFTSYNLDKAFVTKQEDFFSYSIEQKSASQVRNL